MDTSLLTRRLLLIILEGLLFKLLTGCTSTPKSIPTPRSTLSSHMQLGVYDWYQTFLAEKTQTYEHQFVNWVGYKSGQTLSPFLDRTKLRGRIPLVTIEPKADPKLNKLGLLKDITDGRYNQTITLIGRDIAKFASPVVIRFMHEFDLSQNAYRYPWVTTNQALYMAAFRHFVTELRKHSAQYASFMWSPSGSHPVKNGFYPGAHYVDHVGCSLYSFPAWDIRYFGFARTFQQIMDVNYRNLKLFNRPIVAAEFGSAKGDIQAAWVKDALLRAPDYPLLKALVYFNAPDSASWGYGLPNPDFGISPTIWKL
jgi:beta-mannanase